MRRFITLSLLFITIAFTGTGAANRAPTVEDFAGWLKSSIENNLFDQYTSESQVVESVVVTLPKNLMAVKEYDSVTISVPRQHFSGDRMFVSVMVKNESKVVSRMNVIASIRLISQVVVATRDVKRGEILSLNNVVVETKSIPPSGNKVIDNLDEVIGREASRNIPRGATIRRDRIITPNMVSTGDMVTVVAQRGGLHITSVAKAKQDGDVGDWIRVMNTESKRTFNAKITGPGSVMVEF